MGVASLAVKPQESKRFCGSLSPQPRPLPSITLPLQDDYYPTIFGTAYGLDWIDLPPPIRRLGAPVLAVMIRKQHLSLNMCDRDA